jgi:glycosyltransferase involved in cell wall biosynthesis
MEQLTALRLTDHVRFLGEQRDTSCLFAAADLYLNTSVSEGLSNSIMEAMAAKLAVVATAVGGTVELIDEEKNGLLFPLGDSDAAERQLTRLVHDPQLRETLGENAQRTIHERYDLQRMVSQVENLYRHLLLSPSGGVMKNTVLAKNRDPKKAASV